MAVITGPSAHEGALAAAEGAAAEGVKVVALALLVAAGWMLQHPYRGLDHDSTLYTLLALARLHPSLSHDIFLRFGSQDRYTLFSPIYAEAIRWLDLGPAAALLTLASQAGLCAGAFLFARRYMPTSLAILGVGFLVVLPSAYGSREIFHWFEDFLTPRLPSEALVLGGLAATLARRYTLGGLCLAVAMTLHPIMASAGLALLFCIFVAIPRPRLAISFCAGGVLVSLLLLLVIHGGAFGRLDDQWFRAVSGSGQYLFLSRWTLEDWSQASMPLAVLASGLFASDDDRTRRLYAASLIIAVSGVVLTYFYCDLLRVVLFTEMQPWRWLWIASVVAIGFSPLIAKDCWRRNLAMKGVPIVLAAACLVENRPTMALVLSLVAVAYAAAAHRIDRRRTAKLLILGSCLLFTAAWAAYVARLLSYVPLNSLSGSTLSILVQWLRDIARDGVLYAAVLALAWRESLRLCSLRGAAVLAASATALCIALAPPAWDSWTNFHYTKSLKARFTPWRLQIPGDAEVVWPETPVGAWYLLDRSSYWSLYQTAGNVFSRPKAIEMQRREAFLAAALAQVDRTSGTDAVPMYFSRANAQAFRIMCTDPSLAFFVSRGNFAPTPFAPIAPDPAKPHSLLYLYRCADFRDGGRTGLGPNDPPGGGK